MRFDSGTKTRLLADMVLSFDPTGTTLEVFVDGTKYPTVWLGAPTQSTDPKTGRTVWAQTGQTTGYFAGPEVASPGGAVVLAVGRHSFETQVTSGADIIQSKLRAGEIVVSD